MPASETIIPENRDGSKAAAHTAGPWEIDDQPHQELRIGVIGDRDVDTEYGFVSQSYFYEVATVADNEDGDANARLIASAPDLLEALKRSADALKRLYSNVAEFGTVTDGEFLDDVHAAEVAARSAIQRAEGQGT